ncbi:MAG: ester cyclase [Bryobacteraceae bacterium]
MAASTALGSITEVQAFINEYSRAWQGTDEEHIMSYYAERVAIQIPGTLMNGKAAVREQFVRRFIIGFPGNRHIAKNMIFGQDVVVVEWSFEAEHNGPFAGRSATGAHVVLPGCSVYEYDSVDRQITAGRIYFDVGALLKQIGAA